MNIDTYIEGRTFLKSQRRNDKNDTSQASGKQTPFAKSKAIQLYRTSLIYHEILKIWYKLWQYQPQSLDSNRASFPAPQCKTLTRVKWNEIVKNTSRWICSWKSNGQRYALLITYLRFSSERVCVMINRRMDMFLVQLHVPLVFYEGTLLTGDLIEDTLKESFRFEVDDIQACNGNIIRNYDAESRHQVLHEILALYKQQHNSQGSQSSKAFEICCKPWYALNNLSFLISIGQLEYLLSTCAEDEGMMTELWRDFWAGTELPDGLILKDKEAPLGLFTVDSVLKFKPVSIRTHDYLPLVSDASVHLYSHWGHKNPPEEISAQCRFWNNTWWRKRLVQSVYQTCVPLARATPLQNALKFSVLTDPNVFHERISEWALDETAGLWKPVKMRHDEKPLANHDSVIEDDYIDMRDGVVTLEEMLKAVDTLNKDQESVLQSQESQSSQTQGYFEYFQLKYPPFPQPVKKTVISHLTRDDEQNKRAPRDVESWIQIEPEHISIRSILPSFVALNFDSIFPYITKYERARVMGTEAERLNSGGCAMVPLHDGLTSVIDIAAESLDKGVLPCIISRPLPNGKSEEIACSNLDTVASVTHV